MQKVPSTRVDRHLFFCGLSRGNGARVTGFSDGFTCRNDRLRG